MIEKRPDIGSPVRCGEGVSKGWMKEYEVKPNPHWISDEVKGARIYGPSERKPITLTAENAGNEVGYVIERDKFDKEMAALAAEEGADIWVKSPALSVMKEGNRVVHEDCICWAHSHTSSAIVAKTSIHVHFCFYLEFDHLITHFIRSYRNDRPWVAIIISICSFCLLPGCLVQIS